MKKMNKIYRVNDLFYSLQGEGRNTGRAALFIRFSGCNLRCPFCDTDFSRYEELTAPEIIARLASLADQPADSARPLVVLTGGEPTLQVDASLIDALHEAGYTEVAMESNGTCEPPANLDWLTVSPKERVAVKHADELKVLFDGQTPVSTYGIEADYHYLQPCDTGDDRLNADITQACAAYIRRHPEWRLSLQTHKLVGFK